MENKWKKVMIFQHKEYQWYIPKKVWTIIYETDKWVLVKTWLFTREFAMKNKIDAGYYCWYIEYIKE